MEAPNSNLEFFNNILKQGVESSASDIHIKTAKIPHYRIYGHIVPSKIAQLVSSEQILAFIASTFPLFSGDKWKEEGHIDYSYCIDGTLEGRFRVNGFYQRGEPSIVFRHVKDNPPTFAELHHEEGLLAPLCKKKDGFILVCGPTGSGKTSTLAAMLSYINHNFDKHIITLEDPIEYNFEDDKCIVNQREIGIDAPYFASGLKGALRQDPDVILVGEMRDADTFRTALHAAETGHLVFSTLHASNAVQAIQRLIEFFPQSEQTSKYGLIANTVKAVITQGLVPALDGVGRVPVMELFVVDAMGAGAIEKGELKKIPQIIESSKAMGSQSFNDHLYRLVKAGTVSKEDAMKFSSNAKALEMNLKGVFLSTGGLVN